MPWGENLSNSYYFFQGHIDGNMNWILPGGPMALIDIGHSNKSISLLPVQGNDFISNFCGLRIQRRFAEEVPGKDQLSWWRSLTGIY